MDETPAQKVGYFIAGAGVILPAMIVSGFMPLWNVLPLPAWIAIAAGSCGIGMAIGHKPRVAALIGGAVAGGCIPFALIGYVLIREKLTATFFSIELLIPGLVGALPGFFVYKLIASAVDPDGGAAADPVLSDDQSFAAESE